MDAILKQPWAWHIAGALIGLMVPVLLLLGNKYFGISGNLRHICAACFPWRIQFFKYEWKKETWNLIFVAGIVVGAFIAVQWLTAPGPTPVDPRLVEELKTYNITDNTGLLPKEIFSFESLLTLKGFIMLVIGGFLVGFGTRYAGGCTSGHAIMGLSTLQWPSLVATICFMIGGVIMANFILPFILRL